MEKRVIIYILLGLGLCLISVPAYSAVYHIDAGVNTSGNGTANSPFKTWSDLPKMDTGDDVFFKCGTTFKPTKSLNITWNGTKSNPAVISAYYMRDGNPVYGIEGAKPIISGSNYTVPGGNYYSGLIRFVNKDYVHIKNLHIYQAGGHAIEIDGDYSNNAAYFVIDNCRIEGAARSGIITARNPSNYGKITNNNISGCAYGWKVKLYPTNWPVVISVAHCPKSNILIKGNYVHENWGEGIGVWRDHSNSANGSGYATIEDNVVWNNRRVDIYIDSTDHNIVRRNLCLGIKTDGFRSATSNNRDWNQFGIWLNNELYAGKSFTANNNRIYNNMVAGHYKGIGIATEANHGAISNNYIYGNTVIGNKINFALDRDLENFNTKNIVIKNNISYCPPDTICKDVDEDPSWFDDKFIADSNAWTKKPTHWGGPNDQITNDRWNKTTGWQNLKEISKVSDFMPISGNPVINNGVSLPELFNSGISINFSNYQAVSPVVDISVETVPQDSKWDMGAVPFQREASQLPSQDKDLKAPKLSIR